MASLFYRLHDTLRARREFLARKVGSRAVSRAEMLCGSIFQGIIIKAEKAEGRDEAIKEWLERAKDLCYDLIDVLEEMSLEEHKVVALSLFNLNLHTTGIHRMRRIINRLAILAVYAEGLGLVGPAVHGQNEDGGRTPLASLAFLLIDGNKVGTGMFREALETAVVVSSIVCKNPAKSLQESDQSMKAKWVESAHNCLIDLFEELKKQRSGSRKMKCIVKGLGTLMEQAEIMGLCPEPVQMENQAEFIRATPTTSLARKVPFHGRTVERDRLMKRLVVPEMIEPQTPQKSGQRGKKGTAQKAGKNNNNNVTAEGDFKFISIVGESGMGKSAMARSVYNDPKVIDAFPHRAWVFFSKKFDQRLLLKVVLKCLTSDPMNEVETEALELRVRQVIKKKKCLVVLDNVQCGNGGFSDEMHTWLQNLFSHCDAGSRILIATRDKELPSITKSTSDNTIELGVLPEEDCLSIIKDCSFESPLDETVLNEVVKHCKGMPLAAKSIGRIVSFKDAIPEELKVQENYEGDLFGLSYSMMLHTLRQCLLYCYLFPENQSIDVGKLIKLWMANDFIVSKPEDMERVGWGYIQKFLGYSIFQEFKWDGHGSFKCKLEGEVINFIQHLAENECHIMHLDSDKKPKKLGDENMNRKKYVSVNPRHCTLNIASQSSLPKSITYAAKLHTLIILSEYSSVDSTNLAILLSHMRRLRALGLSSCSIKELPRSVGELLHLRYLDLSFNQDLKKLPQAICNLLNLQTLNLNGCRSLQKLPKGIGKLSKLRHLEILWTLSLTYLPKGIASLTSLRTLSRFFGNSGPSSKACNLGDLGQLNQVQGSVIIDGLGGETNALDAKKANLKSKKDLLGLELRFSAVGSDSNHKDILESLEAPAELQGLGIFYYQGESFPKWMIALQNLTHLLLADCSNCSVLPPLGKLLSLQSLKIQNVPNVKKVDLKFLGIESNNGDEVQEDSFPKLKELCFQDMDNWEEWIETSSKAKQDKIMPSLRSLSIINCKTLKADPAYIDEKKNLRYVIQQCPELAGHLHIDKPKDGWSTPIKVRDFHGDAN
ncbi:hypothetical protein PIB30_033516 [Stylosanthes scabra]|uniref:Uncharacterized protein n=1 Tax=Stylosanthes scabra TaxID=79078 RepID=A0ABU6RCU4_9FABA|nr:hypothetical protein [Stylosanthes scabra]